LPTVHVASLIASLLVVLSAHDASANDFAAARAGAGFSMVPNIVHFDAGLLSVKVRDVALLELLDEVSRQADFTVMPYAATGRRVSLEFNQLPLAEALLTILKDRSSVLEWKSPITGKRASADALLERLWLLPAPGEKHLAQLALPAKVSGRTARAQIDVAALRAALKSGASESREHAAIALGQAGGASALAALAQALTDSDVDVQQAAIESLAEIGGADSVGALAVALRDRNPRIREAAVNALGDIDGKIAIALLQQAQTDETAFVRQAATETLDQLWDAAR